MRVKLQTRAVLGFALLYALFAVLALTANYLLLQRAYLDDESVPTAVSEALVTVAAEQDIEDAQLDPILEWLFFDEAGDGDELLTSLDPDLTNALLAEAFDRAETTQEQDSLEALLRISIAIASASAALATAIAWWLSRRLFRPVQRITTAAASASVTNLTERIDLDGPGDELKAMADAFDAMLERLQDSFLAQSRFAANAAHELRTPLAVIRAEIDAARTNPATSPEQLVLVDAIDAAARRSDRLVTSLLELNQAEAGIDHFEAVDLGELVGNLTVGHAPLFTAARLQLDLSIHDHGDNGNLIVHGNGPHLSLIAANLIANAAHHSPPNTTASVDLRPSADGRAVVLTITNAATAVELDDLNSLLEPLQRGRKRIGDGGNGLGLAIAHAAAKAHQATLTLQQPDPASFRAILRVDRFSSGGVTPSA
jgi:two-component system sensor histidine kinase VanS